MRLSGLRTKGPKGRHGGLLHLPWAQDSGVWPGICHFWHISLSLAFTVWVISFQMESILEQNLGEKLGDEGFDPEARTLWALYVVVSILLQLEKSTSVSS